MCGSRLWESGPISCTHQSSLARHDAVSPIAIATSAPPLASAASPRTARYRPLRDLLVRLLPGWEVEIQTYTVGIRGSHDPDRWYAQMRQLEVTAAQSERLMQDMVEQALTELTAIYNVRYAALRHANHA